MSPSESYPQTPFTPAPPVSDAQAIIDEAKTTAIAQHSIGDRLPAFTLPKDWELRVFPELLHTPLRKTGEVRLSNMESFIRFFNEHKESPSRIFVDADTKGTRGAVFTAIFNFHGGEDNAQDFGDFRATYAAELSPEWNKWVGKSKISMNHAQFIEHLEDSQDIITAPAGGELIEMMRDIEGTSNGQFRSVQNLHNGSATLMYAEDVSAGNPRDHAVKVPLELKVRIMPFDFGARYEMTNKLRYRVVNKSITFSYDVRNTEITILDAVQDQANHLAEKTEVHPFYGLPPSPSKAY